MNLLLASSWIFSFIFDIFQVRRTFSTPSWRDHHDTWKEQRYNWLPSWKDIPKHLHDPLDSSHLQKLSVSNIYYQEAAVTHFIVFTKWSVMVKSAQNYRIFVTSIQNSPTIILLFEPADWLNFGPGWHYSLSFLVYFKFAKNSSGRAESISIPLAWRHSLAAE